MAKRPTKKRSAAAIRIDESLAILASLNVPREQQNERSALVLLALLGMAPRKSWSDATDPMLGITEMMDVFRDQFGKDYAPNTRETVRRSTVHQFVQMGLLAANPDNPHRPVNSPANRYPGHACPPRAGSDVWLARLEGFLGGIRSHGQRTRKAAAERA